MNTSQPPFFETEKLKAWFKYSKRTLPWRQNPSPYAIWVSEVMLQQTQVAVVVPYFEKWMALFPTVEALAAAPLELVLKAWEGLGYYSRARNLHAGAHYLQSAHQATLPCDPLQLKQIKGLGPYTIGAIRSFAFRHKVAAVDGNVMRVLCRYFLIQEDICQRAVQQRVWQLAADILPDEESWIFNEALIELGATVCSKKPKCAICPIQAHCAAYQQGLAEKLPIKTSKLKIEKLQRYVAIVESVHKRLLVKRGQPGQIMSGLQEFPYFAIEGKPCLDALRQQIEQLLGQPATLQRAHPQVTHSFTRYQATLLPFYFTVQAETEVAGYTWQALAELDQQAFSAGHRRIYADWKALNT